MGPSSRPRRRCAPTPCCWVGAATSGSARGGSARTGEWADRLNSLPKYVVSSTLEHPCWSNTTVLKGDWSRRGLEAQAGARRRHPRLRQLSARRTLIEHDLVDELRLVVFPVVARCGKRLFGETSDKKPLRLLDSQTIGDGLVYLTYELVR